MDIQKDYSCLERNKSIFRKTLEAENDYQETLPAYCDDIYKVIKCVAKNSIVSSDINYNEVMVNCRCRIYLTYLNENGNLCFTDFEEEYSRSISVEGLTDKAFTCTTITDKYTNCRVINQRRIDIHSVADISMAVFDRVKYPCLVSCENAKLKTETITLSDIVGDVISKIDFDEEFSVPADEGQIRRIVSFTADAFVTDTKIIKDKALVKCTVNLAVLYTVDADGETIKRAVYSFNCSRILEISGIDEKDIAITSADVSNIYLKAKLSSADKMSMISVFGDVSIHTVFIRENEIDVINDGYLLNNRSECQYSQFSYCHNGIALHDSKTVNMTFSMPDEITEIKESDVALSVPVFKGKKTVSAVTLHIIGTDAQGNPVSFSATGETELYSGDASDTVSAVGLQSYDYAFSHDGNLVIRMNIQLDIYAYNEGNLEILSDVEAGEPLTETPSLTLYFGKKSELLWDIAKKFCSDEALIADENGITSAVLDSDRAIIIPRV